MLKDIKDKVARWVAHDYELDEAQVMQLLVNPKSIDHGHVAFPVFSLAKSWKLAPPKIAEKMKQELEVQKEKYHIEKIDAVGGYLNFHVKNGYLQNDLMHDLWTDTKLLGHSTFGDGQRLVIDFSSPNVAKPMHVGHLRATVIGQCIYNLSVTQGYKVIGLNHLGDWGVQFGKLAWAFMEWGKEYDFEKASFDSLYALYVRFHSEAEKDNELNKSASLVFKKLEEGDPKIFKLWKTFVDISMKDYNRIWALLRVKHDLMLGESFYNDKMKPVEEKLEKSGLLVKSQGADVVLLEDEGHPPCLIRKSDGASLYATRDLASAIYRKEVLKADLNLYVVGVDQTLHFQQVFKVLEKMNYSWAKNCKHISFGMYRFKGRMSSRKGNVVLLEDILKRSISEIDKRIEEKNPTLVHKSEVARQVGVGAIIFNDLINDRVKDVDFDWEKALDFNGDSGPYVQYCYVRCSSIIKKYGKPVPKEIKNILSTHEERELIYLLLQFQEVLSLAFKNFKPNLLATYVLNVCKSFNHFYHKNKVLGVDPQLEQDRIALVYATSKVVEKSLDVLNMEAPKAM